MDYKEKYEKALERAKEFQKSKDGLCVLTAESIFPELKESEDEKIRKEIIDFLWKEKIFLQEVHSSVENNSKYRFVMDAIAWLEKQKSVGEIVERCKDSWYNEGKIAGMAEGLTNDEKYQQGWHDALEKQGEQEKPTYTTYSKDVQLTQEEYDNRRVSDEATIKEVEAYKKGLEDAQKIFEKQGEQKPILNVPSREVILSIWDLGNEWKELTNGSSSTIYGTQLDYIQNHWNESEYYLREKQGEQKVTTIDFNAKDWYVSKVDGKIHNMTYNAADNVEKKGETKNEQEALNNWYVEYVYILDYSTGRVIVAKHDVEESISELFEQLGLKESQCHYMTSSNILSIEYINF